MGARSLTLIVTSLVSNSPNASLALTVKLYEAPGLEVRRVVDGDDAGRGIDGERRSVTASDQRISQAIAIGVGRHSRINDCIRRHCFGHRSRVAGGDHRRIVGAVDGDGDGSDRLHQVIVCHSDVVGDRQRLAVGEEIEIVVGGGEYETDRAGAGPGAVGGDRSRERRCQRAGQAARQRGAAAPDRGNKSVADGMGVGQIEVGKGQRAGGDVRGGCVPGGVREFGDRMHVGAGGPGSIGGHNRCVVGAGDGDDHGLVVVGRRRIAVGGADGVGELQCFAVGQEVEGLRCRVEVPVDGAVGVGIVDHVARIDAQHRPQHRIGEACRTAAVTAATDGDRGHRGRHRVGEVGIGHRQRARGGQRGIALGQVMTASVGRDIRGIVGAGDGDDYGLVVVSRRRVAVGGADGVGELQRLAGRPGSRTPAEPELKFQWMVPVGVGIVDHVARIDTQHRPQHRIGEACRTAAVTAATDGDRGHRGRHRVGEVGIGHRQRARGGQRGIALGQVMTASVGRDIRGIIGAGDGDDYGLVVVSRRRVAVGGADGVGELQCLAGRQEVERLRSGVKIPVDGTGGVGIVDHVAGIDAQHRLQHRIGQAGRTAGVARASDADPIHRGRHRVGDIGVAHRQRARGGQRGIALGRCHGRWC